MHTSGYRLRTHGVTAYQIETRADLIALDDDALLRRWRDLVITDWREPSRDWHRRRYRHMFADQTIFEFGCGLGADGIFFMRRGTRWTFSDINNETIEVVHRVCRGY